MEEPRLPRRTFLKGAVATVVLGAGIGAGVVVLTRDDEVVPPRPGAPEWLPDAPSAVFRQDVLTDDDAVYASGGRRSAADTAGYADDDVAKGRIVADPGPPRLLLPGRQAGLVVPAAGLVPRDGWTATLAVRNTGSADVTHLPSGEAPWMLLTVGAIVLWLREPDVLAVSDFETGQDAAIGLQPADWPAGGTLRLTLGHRPHDGTLWLTRDSHDERVLADPPDDQPDASALSRDGLPPGGVDDGLMLGGSENLHQPFEISGTELHRGLLAPGDAPDDSRTLRVDATAAGDPWPAELSGVLAVYAGFVPGGVSVAPEVRDRQFELVFDEAGSRLVRFGGPLNLIEVTLADEEPDYDFSELDDELDALLADRPELGLHLTLDYTPQILQPPGGDHRSPPTDPEAWAAIAVEVVAHVVDRYGPQLRSVTLWNEPDFGDEYWLGDAEQIYDLWERTQRRLLQADHGHLLGSPEYATTAGIQDFFTWLATRTEQLQASVDAIYVHDFQQDLRAVRQRMADARAAADAAGVTDVPIRLTEYNLALWQIPERRNDEDSWYRTQPPHFTTEYAAAHALHLLWEALDQDDDLDMAVFAAIGAQELFWGEQGLVTSDPDERVQPYPALATIELLAGLEGRRIVADCDHDAVRALATVAENGTIMVVYASFRPYRGFLEQVTVDLAVDGLPESFTWRQWRMDRDHLDDHRMVEVDGGDHDDLPEHLELGALGLGAIRIEPT